MLACIRAAVRSSSSLRLFVALQLLVVLYSVDSKAEVIFSKEDRATVRVLAVKGVVKEMVIPPEDDGKKKKPVAIAITEGGHGSGVLLTADGIVATAQHVIDDAEFVAVKLPTRPDAVLAVVLYESKKHDVAFLKIPGRVEDFIPLPETIPDLLVREPVFALGYPLDGTRKFPQSNAGVVAGTLPSGELQLGISANPGNSGGPLISADGRLLGLVIRSANPTKGAQGIAVAVPVEVIKKYFDRRVIHGVRLKKARSADKQLYKTSGAAEVIARVAAITTLGTAIEHIEEKDEQLRAALISSRSSHGRSADFLAILSGHFWNESIIRFTMDGQGWRKPKNEATFLAKRAVALDPSVVQRSPFLHSVLGNKAAVRNADKLRHSAPRRVAGFALGWSSTEAREACTIEDLDFKAKQGGGLCSEPPTADSFTGPVVLKFKNDQIVRVDVIDRPSRALSKVWVRDFKNLYAQFKERYGKHDKQEVNVPSPCRNNLLTCLREGKARLSYQWLWGGRRLTLWLGRRDGKAAMVVSLMDESLRSRSSRIVAQAPSSH